MTFFLTDHQSTYSVYQNEHYYPLWLIMDWSILALLTTIACILGASVAGGTLVSWQVHRRALRLEYRVADLEDRIQTVNKKNAAAARWEKPDRLLAEVEALKGAVKSPQHREDPPWFRESIG